VVEPVNSFFSLSVRRSKADPLRRYLVGIKSTIVYRIAYVYMWFTCFSAIFLLHFDLSNSPSLERRTGFLRLFGNVKEFIHPVMSKYNIIVGSYAIQRCRTWNCQIAKHPLHSFILLFFTTALFLTTALSPEPSQSCSESHG
jgi:hypothetical protein